MDAFFTGSRYLNFDDKVIVSEPGFLNQVSKVQILDACKEHMGDNFEIKLPEGIIIVAEAMKLIWHSMMITNHYEVLKLIRIENTLLRNGKKQSAGPEKVNSFIEQMLSKIDSPIEKELLKQQLNYPRHVPSPSKKERAIKRMRKDKEWDAKVKDRAWHNHLYVSDNDSDFPPDDDDDSASPRRKAIHGAIKLLIDAEILSSPQ